MEQKPQTMLKGYKCDGKTSARQDFFNIQRYLTNRKEKEKDKHSYGSHRIKGQQTFAVRDRQSFLGSAGTTASFAATQSLLEAQKQPQTECTQIGMTVSPRTLSTIMGSGVQLAHRVVLCQLVQQAFCNLFPAVFEIHLEASRYIQKQVWYVQDVRPTRGAQIERGQHTKSTVK